MTMTTKDPKECGCSPCGGRCCSVLREAVDWVFVAAAIGILFNLYDSDGIELRPKPKSPSILQNIPKTEPASYPGFKKDRNPPTVQPAGPTVTSSFTHLSLEGARLRYGKALFVDARPAKDYPEGHIAGAIPFDVNDFANAASKALPLLPRDREILAYCSGGDCDDSVMLAGKLRDLGYKDIKIYDGGYPEWKKAGMPVSKGDAP